MPDIHVMTPSDIDFAVSMTDLEGWGNVAADFARLLALEPEGCFIAWEDGERVGMISTTTYGDYAFMGSLIVRPDRRRLGAGQALMRAAMAHLRDRNITCIELDATPEGAPIYRRLGFIDKYSSLRFFRRADTKPPVGAGPELNENSAATARIVADIDNRLTGLDRSGMLTRLIEEFPDSALVDLSSRGFALVYPRSANRYTVGPLIAENAATAEQILTTIVQLHAAHDLSLGVPETQPDMSRLLIARGLTQLPPSLRMYWGQKRQYESHVYAIVSPEKG